MNPIYRYVHYDIRTKTEMSAWQFIKDIPMKTLFSVEDKIPTPVEQIVEDNVSNIVLSEVHGYDSR